MQVPVFHTYLLRFVCRRPVERHFAHCAFVHGLVSRFLGHPLPDVRSKPRPQWVAIPFPLETGVVSYDAGDPYALGITFVGRDVPSAENLTDVISRALRKSDADTPAIGSDLELSGIELLPRPDPISEIESIKCRERMTLQFVTPLYIEHKAPDRDPIVFDADYFDCVHFLKTLYFRLYDLAALDVESSGIDTSKTPLELLEQDHELWPPNISIERNGLQWLNVPTPDRGAQNPEYYGAVGSATLCGDFSAWAKYIVAGQYAHIGKRPNFGFGRYIVREASNERSKVFVRSSSFLKKVAEETNLRTAWETESSNGVSTETDRERVASFRANVHQHLESLGRQLLLRSYAPGELLGVVVEGPDGRVRALAVPTVGDRIAQRAATQVLALSVDRLLGDYTNAYRRGLSRLNARYAIERGYRDGFRWVLKVDIEDFFDNVDWARLFDKLDAFFPFEPLMEIVKKWVTAPVRYEGQLIVRTQGLPQGSAIAPLLANLCLDEFDEDMKQFGFRLVRYADDFVVLCRSRADAERAFEASRESLKDLHLEVDQTKVSITNLDTRFRYLGYLFWRSVTRDAKNQNQPTDQNNSVITSDRIPKHGWLALTESLLQPLSVDAGSPLHNHQPPSNSS